MSTNLKIQRRAGNYPQYLRRFLLLSLLIHGTLFLGLAIYKPRIFSHRLVQKPDKLLPVQLIEVPPDEVGKTPPPNAKNLATNNSRAGGKPGSKSPVSTEATSIAAANRNTTVWFSHLPNSHHSKAFSTLSQPPGSKQQAYHNPLPSLSKSPINPLTIKTEPKLNTRRQPSPIREDRRLVELAREPQQQTPKPNRLAFSTNSSSNPTKIPNQQEVKANNSPPPHHTPSLLATLANFAKHQILGENYTQSLAPQPATSARRPAVTSAVPVKTKPRQILSRSSGAFPSPVVRSSRAAVAAHPIVHLAHPTRLAFGSGASSRLTTPTPKPNHSSRPLQSSGASLLGGPVTLASGKFSNDRHNLPDAARLATDFRGADARQDNVLAPYLEILKEQIRQKWHPVRPDASKLTRIVFSISSTGQVYGLSIIRPSGSELIDQAAVKAVQRAAPFAPLPQGFSRLDIDCTFNVDVYGNLEVN